MGLIANSFAPIAIVPTETVGTIHWCMECTLHCRIPRRSAASAFKLFCYRSHAPAWECICVPLLRHGTRSVHRCVSTETVGTIHWCMECTLHCRIPRRSAANAFKLFCYRSHAPAWECICVPLLRHGTRSVHRCISTETVGTIHWCMECTLHCRIPRRSAANAFKLFENVFHV